jgi:hypothetical protein
MALVQVQARVAARQALRLGPGERDVTAGQVAQIALAETGGSVVSAHLGTERRLKRGRADADDVVAVHAAGSESTTGSMMS